MLASPQQHLDAVLAALETAKASPLALGKVPLAEDDRPDWYTEVTVTRRFGGTDRGSGERNTIDLIRVTLRQVARIEANANRLRLHASAMENTTITVNGVVSTPWEFETEDPIGPDEDWHSGLQTWIYSL